MGRHRGAAAAGHRLGLAAVAKITDPDEAVRAVRAYQLLPEALVRPVAWGLSFAELALALLLAVGLATRLAAAGSAVLLGVFMVAIASAWDRGLQNRQAQA